MTPAPRFSANNLTAKLLQNLRGATPLAIEQLDILLRLTAAACEQLGRCVCLGADLDVLVKALLDEHPNARAVVIEEAATLLEDARKHLEEHRERVHFLHHNPGKSLDELRGDEIRGGRPGYDLLVISGSVNWNHQEHRELLSRALALLRPGGLLLNIGNVASATRWTESVLDDYLIEALFGEELRNGSGKTRAEIARETFERNAKAFGGAPAPLEVQCQWLRELGCENVDCYSKVEELAIYGGQKPLA